MTSYQGVNDISVTSGVTGAVTLNYLIKVEFARFSIVELPFTLLYSLGASHEV